MVLSLADYAAWKGNTLSFAEHLLIILKVDDFAELLERDRTPYRGFDF